MDKDQVLGSSGDFTTSPEISQIFGEMLGVWFTAHIQQEKWDAFQLVELGPGKGTLMVDVLRTLSQFQPMLQRMSSIHLVEASPKLKEIQRRAIASLANEAQMPSDAQNCFKNVHWHEYLEEVPRGMNLWAPMDS